MKISKTDLGSLEIFEGCIIKDYVILELEDDLSPKLLLRLKEMKGKNMDVLLNEVETNGI